MVQVLERDSKLSELDQRADNLQEGASQFQTQVKSIKTGGVQRGGRLPYIGEMDGQFWGYG
jgi:hypothetical protein